MEHIERARPERHRCTTWPCTSRDTPPRSGALQDEGTGSAPATPLKSVGFVPFSEHGSFIKSLIIDGCFFSRGRPLTVISFWPSILAQTSLRRSFGPAPSEGDLVFGAGAPSAGGPPRVHGTL